MSTLLWVIGSVLGVGGIVGVVYYVHRLVLRSAALDERDAALELEQQRIAAMEKAKDAERAVRAEEFEREKDAATSAAAAAELLQQAADDTAAN